MQPDGEDSAAGFYAKLVNADAAWSSAAAEGDAQQYQQSLTPQTGPTASSAQWTQQQPNLQPATTANAIISKPVKFASPIILDPNTGIMTLPAKTADPNAPSRSSHSGIDVASQASRHRLPSRHIRSHPQQQQQQHQQPQQTAVHPAGPSAMGSSYKRPIDRGNVGYQLLKKAGWQEGKGIGREEQGMAAPLQVVPQKGNKGLGFASQNPALNPGLAQAGSGSSSKAGDAAAAGPVAGPMLGGKRVAALVAEELAAEDLDTKVKRHRQVMQQEARDKKDKAIQSYLYRAFNEPSTADTGDSNPLGKNHRLTATNPLLD